MTDRDDLDTLLNSLIGFATDQQAKHGGFLPYSGTLARGDDASVDFQMAQTGDEYPSAIEMRQMTLDGLKRKATEGSIRACALVSDVNIKEGAPPGYSEAIHMHLEHESGRVVQFNLPYRKNGDSYEYADALFEPGIPEVFAA